MLKQPSAHRARQRLAAWRTRRELRTLTSSHALSPPRCQVTKAASSPRRLLPSPARFRRPWAARIFLIPPMSNWTVLVMSTHYDDRWMTNGNEIGILGSLLQGSDCATLRMVLSDLLNVEIKFIILIIYWSSTFVNSKFWNEIIELFNLAWFKMKLLIYDRF